MVKPNLSRLAKGLRVFASKHGPEILTGIGVSGMFVAVGFAIHDTPKAIKLIEQRKERENIDELSPMEVFETVWKCYIPTAITLVMSSACVIGASAANVKRNAALATAYTLSETALSEYREKLIETIGPEKEREIRNDIDRDRVEKHSASTKEVVVLGHNNVLCMDYYGRTFESNMTEIDRAINNLNYNLLRNDYASLNEFYDELGLSHTAMGDKLGWRIDKGKVDIEYSSQVTDDGRPCLVISYTLAPEYDYAKFW